MKIIIHPRYAHLTAFLEELPQRFRTEGRTIYSGRNEIRIFEAGQLKLVAKSFRKPHIFNQIAYSFFRPSKAERSYGHAVRLLEKGIDTPAPVAYIEDYRGGLLAASYYIAVYKEYPGLLRELDFRPLEEVRELVEAFAHFTADLHNKGVLHIDYSPGNILYKHENGQYSFCIVDLNRMKFTGVNMKTGCFNLRKLWATDEIMTCIARIYAADRRFDAEKCISLTLSAFRKFWEKREKKKRKRK
ncbi:MAG: hypothetical protein LBR34_09050 [Prevotella sp.]|jgi:serine/threonine protein kinase|nr:hypothetical protein [Prevotella sp.]